MRKQTLQRIKEILAYKASVRIHFSRSWKLPTIQQWYYLEKYKYE